MDWWKDRIFYSPASTGDTVHTVPVNFDTDAIIVDVSLWKRIQDSESSAVQYIKTSPDITIGDTAVTIDMTGFPVGEYLVRVVVDNLSLEDATKHIVPIVDPIVDQQVVDPDYGYCRYLDDLYPIMNFAQRFKNVEKIVLDVVSGTSTVSGNICIIPIVNGVDREPVIVPVTGTLTSIQLSISFDFGTLSLKRDTENSLDTLKGDTTITAIVLGVTLETSYHA